jgi:Carboxypeptidase regulatory-like domain
MTQRIPVALALVLFVSPAVLLAQTPLPAPPPGSETVVIRGGVPMPGPQVAPPRDGPAATAQTGTGRIRGRVVAAETGSPLRRAQVVMVGAPSAGQNGQQVSRQVASTDADGRYEFSNLPAARYTLTVTRSGFVSLQFGQQRPFEPGKPLSLAEGEVAEKIDFALPRGGVIAGRVTDETGEPVPGVRMQAQRYQYMPGGQRRLVGANTGPMPMNPMTDDLGQFRVYGLMPGAYILSAAPGMNGLTMFATAGGATVTSSSTSSEANDGFAPTYFPGTANVEDAQAITVGLGQEVSAYLTLVSARMGRISGVVRNSQGQPVTNRTSVSLRTASGTGFSTMGFSQSNADGTFSLANVPPGEHVIDVRPMPGPPRATASPDQSEDEFASIPVTIGNQDVTGLVITTGPGATISGRLVFDGTSQKPTAPQLRVGVTPADISNPMAMMSMGFTPDNGLVDENGAFRLRSVNGSVFFRTGAQGWNLKSVTLNGEDITDTPFDAKPSSNVAGLEITLTDRQTSLSGIVKNAQGDATKDFVVAIFPAEPKIGAAATRFTRTIRPDQEGRYQLRGLPPGDYVAAAVESLEQGGEWDPAFQQQMKPRAKTFRLNEGQVLTLDLQLVP